MEKPSRFPSGFLGRSIEGERGREREREREGARNEEKKRGGKLGKLEFSELSLFLLFLVPLFLVVKLSAVLIFRLSFYLEV